jgi:hypothetical protein
VHVGTGGFGICVAPEKDQGIQAGISGQLKADIVTDGVEKTSASRGGV